MPHDIIAAPRVPQTEEDTPDKLENGRNAEQEFVDNAEPLTEEELAEKDALVAQGFESWSCPDCQQSIEALEAHGCTDEYNVIAAEILDETAEVVKAYYPVLKKQWKILSNHPRIAQCTNEGEAKRNKRP
ncbi:unnamed protein product [Peniophora sp. CBMAI 1063]|nr:unnamed protein product [Peniophora sp. CBMAI 1063]